MSKFKVGDIVEVIDNRRIEGGIFENLIIGSRAKIVKPNFTEYGEEEKVLIESMNNSFEGRCEYYARRFRLINPIILTENSTELERWMVLLNE